MSLNFNLINEKAVLGTEKKAFVDPKLLVVKPENGKNGTYQLSVRFLPNLSENASSSIYEKNFVKVSTGQNGETVMFDMPRKTGCISIFRTADKILKELKFGKQTDEDTKAIVNEIGNYFSSFSYYYAYAYIEKDVYRPENEKTVKILRFPYKIKKMFTDEENIGIDVFSLTEGKRFIFKVSKQGSFPEYTGCHFSDETSQFQYYDEADTLRIASDVEVQAIMGGQKTPLRDFLEANIDGSLERYNYQEPTKEQLVKAANLFRQVFFKYPSIYNAIMSETNDFEMKSIVEASQPMQMQAQVGSTPVVSETAYVPTSGQVEQAKPVDFNTAATTEQPYIPQQPVQPTMSEDDPLGYEPNTDYSAAWSKLMSK